MTWLCSSPDPPARPDPHARPVPSPRSDPHARRPAGPRQPPLIIEVRVGQAETTVLISGELDLTTRPVLAERLSAVLQARPKRLILDMSGTSFMDVGSARLIAGAGGFLPGGRRLVIRRPSQPVRRVLGLTGLDARCQIEG